MDTWLTLDASTTASAAGMEDTIPSGVEDGTFPPVEPEELDVVPTPEVWVVGCVSCEYFAPGPFAESPPQPLKSRRIEIPTIVPRVRLAEEVCIG